MKRDESINSNKNIHQITMEIETIYQNFLNQDSLFGTRFDSSIIVIVTMHFRPSLISSAIREIIQIYSQTLCTTNLILLLLLSLPPICFPFDCIPVDTLASIFGEIW